MYVPGVHEQPDLYAIAMVARTLIVPEGHYSFVVPCSLLNKYGWEYLYGWAVIIDDRDDHVVAVRFVDEIVKISYANTVYYSMRLDDHRQMCKANKTLYLSDWNVFDLLADEVRKFLKEFRLFLRKRSYMKTPTG